MAKHINCFLGSDVMSHQSPQHNTQKMITVKNVILMEALKMLK